MQQKKAQFAILALITLVLLLALSAGWFLAQRGPESTDSRQNGQEQRQADSAEDSESERDPSQVETNQTPPESEGAAHPGLDVVTGTFVQDLAEFVVSRYHPEWGLDNPRDTGMLNLSVRALNVRYGRELIGLRHSQSKLDKARQEILSRLLDPDTLKHAYIRYADSFVQAMIRRARDSTRRVSGSGEKPEERALGEPEVSEMLRLGASYLRDVSGVLEFLGGNPEMDTLVRDYLEAKDQAVHFNYRLNQLKDKMKKSRNSRAEGENATELRERLDSVVQRYGRSIARRERARQKLVDRVRQGAGESLDLEVSEILYLAEWVHRRLPGEDKRPAIETSGRLLEDLAGRLDQRAEDIGAG